MAGRRIVIAEEIVEIEAQMLAETLEIPVRAAPALRELGQLVRAEHQQRDQRDDGEVGRAETGEHNRDSAVRRVGVPGPLLHAFVELLGRGAE